MNMKFRKWDVVNCLPNLINRILKNISNSHNFLIICLVLKIFHPCVSLNFKRVFLEV